MDLAKDPCARANLKTQPARSIEPFASEGGVRSEPELLFLAYQKIDGGLKRWDLSQDPLRLECGLKRWDLSQDPLRLE